jgi:hypothetical protein
MFHDVHEVILGSSADIAFNVAHLLSVIPPLILPHAYSTRTTTTSCGESSWVGRGDLDGNFRCEPCVRKAEAPDGRRAERLAWSALSAAESLRTRRSSRANTRRLNGSTPAIGPVGPDGSRGRRGPSRPLDSHHHANPARQTLQLRW